MPHHIRLTACLLLLCSTAFGQMGGGGRDRPAPQFPDIDRETLILNTPDKWYPFSRRTEALVDTLILPTGQEPSDWKEALRQEVYLTTAGVTAPRQIFELRSESDRERCTSFESAQINDQPENGYDVYLLATSLRNGWRR
jgi:hypothetical protein